MPKLSKEELDALLARAEKVGVFEEYDRADRAREEARRREKEGKKKPGRKKLPYGIFSEPQARQFEKIKGEY